MPYPLISPKDAAEILPVELPALYKSIRNKKKYTYLQSVENNRPRYMLEVASMHAEWKKKLSNLMHEVETARTVITKLEDYYHHGKR